MARLTELAVEVAGEELVLRGDRTLYWPAQDALVVADVHVGKTESLRADGVALPDGAMFDDLVRLSVAQEATGAGRVIVIGDLVHDRQGLTPMVREFVARWRRTHPCRLDLVLGNHDRKVAALPGEWDLVVHDPMLRLGGMALSHDGGVAGVHTLVGHLHPAIRLGGGVDGVRVPCFHLGRAVTTLPAFSTLTSGLGVRVAAGERVVAVVDGFVVPLPGP